MKVNLCTISFRHVLASIENIVEFAIKEDFYGIELWGVHAKALSCTKFLDNPRVRITMISDYIDLIDPTLMIEKCQELINLCHRFNCNKVRIFAGDKARDELSHEEEVKILANIHWLCQRMDSEQILLVVETHPGTWADSLPATLELIERVDHHNLYINLDVLHVWEAGDSPSEALTMLDDRIVNVHLKNITHHEHLHVFSPLNVYSPSGNRIGMTHLSSGAICYKHFLSQFIKQHSEVPLSIEWFGTEPFRYLEEEKMWIQSVEDSLLLGSEQT
ncbi:sugar phosphate isomerase/epimerase family protein [Fictibacillus norfolkensis]|uniref:Sugar phosphate isomerase/epimerase n=1 Tax=Fictibacillus norfolkensis TaxID=2762233 RepID=A0ABR8SGY1_9BACL|nr:sugar phosphate isomerase/epimerase [Fictibacillus norfolkensis]MBD7962754.1 sugar phosphate isomerase/epimerase [Fictibacillus norfolkensis]